MNYLIILNNAESYRNLFTSIGDKLILEGHNVTYVLDSFYSQEYNDLMKKNCFIFQDFAMKNKDKILDFDAEYYKDYLRIIMADWERGNYFGFSKGKDYYEKIVVLLDNFAEHVLLNQNIDIVIYENVSNGLAYIFQQKCKYLGKKYKGIVSSRFPGRFSVFDDPLDEKSIIESIYLKIKDGSLKVDADVLDSIHKYCESITTISPDYMSFNSLDDLSLTKRYFKISKIRPFILGLKYYFDDHYYNFQMGNPMINSINQILFSLKRVINSRLIKFDFYSVSDIDCNASYYLYPLHFHPESSTSINSRFFLDEYELIRNISFSLPKGTRLLVKEHISGFGINGKDFYKKLSKLPNVYSVAPNVNAKELIKLTIAVVTQTSTVGYEALILQKPVILFGSVFYEFHPSVIKVSDFNLLYQSLSSALTMSVESPTDFAAAYYLATYDGVLNTFKSKNEVRIDINNIWLNSLSPLLEA